MNLELEEVVGLISKQPAELIASLKGDDGEWKTKDEIFKELRRADKERLDAVVKGENGKAVRLRMKKAQDFIREQYGVESDSPELEDHLKTLVEKMGKPGQERVVEKLIDLDETRALEHPVVKALLKSEVQKTTAELNRQLEEKEKKHREYVEAEEQKRLDTILIQEAERTLAANKAALDKDPEVRAKQVKRFVAGLKTDYRFKMGENGRPIPVDSHGEQLAQDYKDVTFADLVKQENIFGVHTYDPDKGSAGAQSQAPARQQRFDVPVPKSMEEYQAALTAERDPAKRIAIKDAYKASLAQPAQ